MCVEAAIFLGMQHATFHSEHYGNLTSAYRVLHEVCRVVYCNLCKQTYTFHSGLQYRVCKLYNWTDLLCSTRGLVGLGTREYMTSAHVCLTVVMIQFVLKLEYVFCWRRAFYFFIFFFLRVASCYICY
jgi:hypothetical protein